ncbi:methyl-accepting chemotaxis protein [Iningainema tapete]|uniref:GAF domain-containing protein n=1 Tax=Iningainema tapete BLCC-T55 TaxID=2748662 RepID=A0A8J6XTS9_9CYAN|nr:methyl-accepting chemotaxis protein [Iningainema tapete]MBD2778324.1 GAF domain-containing protein [Iningainema tapete BLCC-T55]
MFNKTDATKSSDGQNLTKISSSHKVSTDSKVERLNRFSGNSPDNPLNQVVTKFGRLSLSTKAIILAITVSTAPVLAVGALTYKVASQSLSEKISQIQENETNGLADKVNRFMIERYGDIQVIASLPILTSRRDNTNNQDKSAELDKFVKIYKVYDHVAVLDLQGNPIVGSQREDSGNRGERDYFKVVDRPEISQPQVSKITGQNSIYALAPVKDPATGRTISIVRARMPVKVLENVVKNYTEAGQEYYITNAEGKVFLATQKKQIGRNALQNFPGLAQQQRKGKEGTFTTVNQFDKQEQLVSYSARTLEDLPDLKWQVILATNANNAFALSKQLLLATALGTGLTALIVALIAAWLAKRATEPIIQATNAVTRLGQGDFNTRIQVESEDELGVLGANINHMAGQLQTLIKEQELDTAKARIISDLTLKVRKNLRTEDIYRTAVKEIRQALKTDRVVIYNFERGTWDGSVVAESVTSGLPQMLGENIDDPCFRDRHVELYKDGRVRAISNIYQDPSLSNAACYIRMLEKFSVKANLVAPIISSDELTGLLIAHHCDAPRNWQQSEIDLFKQIAIQVGYALEQAKLLEELELAKSVAENSSDEERQQKEALQMQLLELLSEVEGAASGDLTVRADVTAGEIGTVADFFNSIVENLRLIVTKVKQTATQVNQAIGSNEEAIHQLAEEALLQAGEINRTLDAVDNMTYSMQAVASSAAQAAVVAQNASSTAYKSGQAMDMTVQNILHLRETVGETAKKVKRLGESTQQISRVVALINQISMQTNLLAINAGIEAARAGEEGQGFAVVAEEVGELAARSAAATKEIEQIVENIQRETSEVVTAMELGTTQVVEGTRIVEDAKHSLSQIMEVSHQIDFLVQSISEATASQVQTSQVVSELMKEIAAVSQRTSDSSRQVSQSLQETVEISQQLQETVGTFKVN